MLNVKFASESDPDTDVTLSFFAAERILGEIIFSERFLFDIGKLIQQKRDYHLNETLKDVKLPSGQSLEGQFVFIVAKSLKESLDFGVLFNRLESGGYHIVGLWPRDFAEICRIDQEVFEFLMFRLINTPDFFSKVTLYQPAEMEMPRMEVKPPTIEVKPPAPPVEMKVPSPPPAAEVAPPFPAVTAPPPKISASATEVKAAVKPPGIELAPPPTPPRVEIRPTEAVPEVPPDLLEGRCPFCKAAIPEPRLKVLQRGSNTFCPKCLKILKGFKGQVAIKAVAEVGISELTQRELDELTKKAEQNVQAKNFNQAASNYRTAAEKAKLLNNKSLAKQLQEKAEECAISGRSSKIQEFMKRADDFFREKNYDGAIKEYKIAVDLAKKAKDVELLKTINTRIRKCAELIVTDKIDSFVKAADQLLQVEKYAEAKQNYMQALDLEQKLGEKETIKLLEQKIADCDTIPLKRRLKEASSKAEKQFKIDKFDEAAQFYKQAASLASQLGDGDAQHFFEQKIQECQTAPLRGQIQSVLGPADAQFQAKDFSGAAAAYNNALAVAKQLDDKNLIKEIENKIDQCSMGEAGIKLQGIIQEANNAQSQQDYSNAIKRYQEAIVVAKQIGKGDAVKSFEEKIKECGTHIKINETLQKAESSYQSKNLEMALSLFKDLSKLATSINDTNTINTANTRIKEVEKSIINQKLLELSSKADILMSEQNYEGAKDKLAQAKDLASQISDSAKIQEISSKISQCEAAITKAKEAVAVPATPPAPTPPTPPPAPSAPAPVAPPAPAAETVKEEKKVIEPSGFLCPFCDFPLPERVVKNLKKGFNDNCPNCNKTLGRLALNI